MKSSRPRIKFVQFPHSVAQRLQSLTNPTAMALLTLLCQKTVGFGQGFVDLSYKQLSQALSVDTRTIARAASHLAHLGVISRARPAGGIYRWRILLEKDEVLEDPNHTYAVRQPLADSKVGVMIDRSAPPGQICHDPHDRSIMTPTPKNEHQIPLKTEPPVTPVEQNIEPLNILIKDKNIKNQQQGCPLPDRSSPTTDSSEFQLAVRRTDDEPLHKFCLRELRKHGISHRIARQLCNNHDHNLIASVLKTAPQRPGVKNLAAYIVSEIKDGGYETTESSSPDRTQKNAHRVSGGRSNYAHLTDHNLNKSRQNSVKTATDAPIAYRTAEQTRAELKTLELQKLEKSKAYREEGRVLAQRFKNLPDNVQFRLKLAASVHLSKLVPMTGNREQILQDRAFQRMANRAVLECFFAWIDEGLNENQALSLLESKAAA